MGKPVNVGTTSNANDRLMHTETQGIVESASLRLENLLKLVGTVAFEARLSNGTSQQEREIEDHQVGTPISTLEAWAEAAASSNISLAYYAVAGDPTSVHQDSRSEVTSQRVTEGFRGLAMARQADFTISWWWKGELQEPSATGPAMQYRSHLLLSNDAEKKLEVRLLNALLWILRRLRSLARTPSLSVSTVISRTDFLSFWLSSPGDWWLVGRHQRLPGLPS